jgi:aminoglycoside phosphotransferase (APT) family kinase protein
MVEVKLLNYLQTIYSEKTDIRIDNLQNITSGWETEIRSFDLRWSENGQEHLQELVVRIYPGVTAVPKAEKEANFMKGVSELGYPVPIVHLVETNASHLGQPFMIMDRIDGGTLDDRLHEDTERWTAEFHRLFVNLHQLDWKRIHPNPESIPSDDPYYYINVTLFDQKEQLKRFRKPELLPVVEWMKERVVDVPCKKLSIVHRDFHTFNILVDEDENSYVIDWGAAGVADFRTDLAWTLLLNYAYDSRERRNSILKGYESALGREVEQIEFFEVLAALRRLIDVTSSFDMGGAERGLRPEAVEMMKETAGHIVRVRDRLEELTGIRIPEIDQFISSITE